VIRGDKKIEGSFGEKNYMEIEKWLLNKQWEGGSTRTVDSRRKLAAVLEPNTNTQRVSLLTSIALTLERLGNQQLQLPAQSLTGSLDTRQIRNGRKTWTSLMTEQELFTNSKPNFPMLLFTVDANRQTHTPSESDPLRTSELEDCSMLMTY